jgi:hypothetical protein
MADDHAKMSGLVIRAGCAPFVAIQFFAVGFSWYDRAGGRIPDNLLPAVSVLAISLGTGLWYLMRLPVGWTARLGFAGLYVLVFPFMLLWYALFFAMVVLGECI